MSDLRNTTCLACSKKFHICSSCDAEDTPWLEDNYCSLKCWDTVPIADRLEEEGDYLSLRAHDRIAELEAQLAEALEESKHLRSELESYEAENNHLRATLVLPGNPVRMLTSGHVVGEVDAVKVGELVDQLAAEKARAERLQLDLDTAHAALCGASDKLRSGDAHEAHGWLTRQDAYDRASTWRRELEAENERMADDYQAEARRAVAAEARAERLAKLVDEVHVYGSSGSAHLPCLVPEGWIKRVAAALRERAAEEEETG